MRKLAYEKLGAFNTRMSSRTEIRGIPRSTKRMRPPPRYSFLKISKEATIFKEHIPT